MKRHSKYKILRVPNFDWSLAVKREAKLVELSIKIVLLVFGSLTASKIKVLWGYSRSVHRTFRRQGYKGLAIYLKTCYLALQQVAGGQIVESPMALGTNIARTRRGIPRIIPATIRREILSDPRLIRLWLSLFGLYRVLPFKGKLKLSTITNPGVDENRYLKSWYGWVPIFVGRLQEMTKSPIVIDPSSLRVRRVPVIHKSGPNSGGFGSTAGLPFDLLSFWQDLPMKSALFRWLFLTGSDAIAASLTSIIGVRGGVTSIFDSLCDVWLVRQGRTPVKESSGSTPIGFLNVKDIVRNKQRRDWIVGVWGKPIFFGKLGLKQEPGKIRVFAMVNLLTQTLMLPLHEAIFTILRKIPQDGTFDQIKPVKELLAKFPKPEGTYIASYDLSAATDRLPVVIQQALLSAILGPELAALWRFLLVGRPYGLPKIVKSYGMSGKPIRYAVGQPMGALSSWAMLALTHHAIVQWAAYRVAHNTTRWFEQYALLGDDIIIADEAVANEYLRIMAELGVEVGIAKSLISRTGSCEFAKRTFIHGQDASPVSAAEISVALRNVASLEELWRKAKTFGEIRLASVSRFAGFGYKNLARLPVVFNLNNRLSRLAGYICRPGGLFPLALEPWVAAIGPGRYREVDWKTGQALARSLANLLLPGLAALVRRLRARVDDGLKVSISQATALQKATARDIEKNPKIRKGSLIRKRVYGPNIGKALGFEYIRYLDAFFEYWVRDLHLATAVQKLVKFEGSVLRTDVERLGGMNALETIWRWCDTMDGLASLVPADCDFFTRKDEVVVSTRLIHLWIRLRRTCSKQVS